MFSFSWGSVIYLETTTMLMFLFKTYDAYDYISYIFIGVIHVRLSLLISPILICNLSLLVLFSTLSC